MPVAEVDIETVRDRVIRLAQKLEGPHDIAQAVLAEIDPEDGVRQAFSEILPEYCRIVLTNQRRSMSRTILEDAAPDATPAVRSAKNDAIRNWFQRYLELQLCVGDTWKRMGDCTADDLMFGAVDRRKKANELLFRAAELNALADALASSDKKHVRDLPEAVVRGALESVR